MEESKRPKRPKQLIIEQWIKHTGHEPTADHWAFAAIYCQALADTAAASAGAFAKLADPQLVATVRGHRKYWNDVAAGMKWGVHVANQIMGCQRGNL